MATTTSVYLLYNSASIKAAVDAAKAVTDKPSIIKIKTTIGFGSKNQGEEKVHGAPLGAEDIKQVKAKFGFSPDDSFTVLPQVYRLNSPNPATTRL